MPDPVKIIECPRDAWQGIAEQIPASTKVAYLQALISAGFKHIDAVSFVSPTAVPQMADSEEVLRDLDPPDDVEIIGIVVNEKGADRAIATEAVRTLGFPYSLSPAFLSRNQSQTLEESFDILEKIKLKADAAACDMVVYISMAFGNPYGDPWSLAELEEAVNLVADTGVQAISIADTVGVADAGSIGAAVGAVMALNTGLNIGVHLHSRPGQAAEKIMAAYDAGCRRFDSALGGLGGCPFAQDAMVGNIPTEEVVAALASRGVTIPGLKPLDFLVEMSQQIALPPEERTPGKRIGKPNGL